MISAPDGASCLDVVPAYLRHGELVVEGQDLERTGPAKERFTGSQPDRVASAGLFQ